MNKLLIVACLVVLLFSCERKASDARRDSINYLKEHNPRLSEQLSKLSEHELSKGYPLRVLYTELQEEDAIDLRMDVSFFLAKKRGVNLKLVASDDSGNLLFESRNVEYLETPSNIQNHYWDVQFILHEEISRIPIEVLAKIHMKLEIDENIVKLPQPERLIRLEGVYVYDEGTAQYALVKRYK